MTRSFPLFAIILGAVLAQTCSAEMLVGESTIGNAPQYKMISSDGQNDNTSIDESDPSLSCLLFGEVGCRVECAVTEQAFGMQGNGVCSGQNCKCYPNIVKRSFFELWNTKFKADDVFRKISKNEKAITQTRNIFNNPFRTAEEIKQLLKPIITPYQFSKLTINDQTVAAKFVKNGVDKVDTNAIQNFVTQTIGELVKGSARSLVTTAFNAKIQYENNLPEALEDAKNEEATLYNIVCRIRQLNNTALEDAMKEYFEKRNLKQPNVDPNHCQDTDGVLTRAIINEMVRAQDENNKPKQRVAAKTMPVARKPPAKRTVSVQRAGAARPTRTANRSYSCTRT